MRKVINRACYMLFILLCVSCRHSMKAPDYVRYVMDKENGLNKVTQVNGWEFSMQYRPYEYIMLMESKGDWSNYNIEKRKKDMEGTAWFSIEIKRTDDAITPLKYGVASLDEYNMRLNYYLNDAKRDIALVYGEDTLRPVSYLFENNYNLTPQETMIVGFYLPGKDSRPVKAMQLSFTDRIFKNGIIKAAYPEKSITSIPNLIF